MCKSYLRQAAKSPDGASAPCLLIFNIPNLFFYCTIFCFSARWLLCFYTRRLLCLLPDSGFIPVTGAQLAAFKLAALNTEPERLSALFTGVLIAVLFLWTARGLLLVYRGYAAGTVAEPVLLRFVVRSVLLLVISLFLCAG